MLLSMVGVLAYTAGITSAPIRVHILYLLAVWQRRGLGFRECVIPLPVTYSPLRQSYTELTGFDSRATTGPHLQQSKSPSMPKVMSHTPCCGPLSLGAKGTDWASSISQQQDFPLCFLFVFLSTYTSVVWWWMFSQIGKELDQRRKTYLGWEHRRGCQFSLSEVMHWDGHTMPRLQQGAVRNTTSFIALSSCLLVTSFFPRIYDPLKWNPQGKLKASDGEDTSTR